jgi:hypothetical protein
MLPLVNGIVSNAAPIKLVMQNRGNIPCHRLLTMAWNYMQILQPPVGSVHRETSFFAIENTLCSPHKSVGY